MAILPQARDPGDVCGGRFRLQRILGRGPSGVVYQASDLSGGPDVALKKLYAHHHDQAVLAAVQKDADLAGRCADPALLAPLVTGMEEDGTFYLATSLFPGESLRARLLRGPLSVADTLALFEPLCAALLAAHQAGLFHGDLCPGNVLLPATGPGVALTDFGMHHLGETRTGTWNGPTGYVPPEVYRGEAPLASGRGDVFALGALLHECLTGARLFDGPHLPAVMFKVCLAPLPALGTLLPAGARRLEGVVSMACARDPEARFENPAAFFHAMQAMAAMPALPTEDSAAHGPQDAHAPQHLHPLLQLSQPRLDPLTLLPASQDTPPREPPEQVPSGQRSTLETWMVSEAAATAEVAQPPGRRRLAVSAALGALGMSAALFLYAGYAGRLRPPAAPVSARAVPVLQPGSPGPGARDAAGADEAALRLTARQRLADRDHAAALAAAGALLRRRPGDAEAQDLLHQATEGLRLSAIFEGFQRALERDEVDTAVALYGELPQGSFFQREAEGDFAQVRGPYDQDHLGFALAASRSGLCDEVDRQVLALARVGSPGGGPGAGARDGSGARDGTGAGAGDGDGKTSQALAEARRLAQRCREREAAGPARGDTHRRGVSLPRPSRLRPVTDLRNPFVSERNGQAADLSLKDPFGSGKLPAKVKPKR